MSHLVHLQQLEATDTGAPVLAGVAFATPWRRLDYVLLNPGQVFSPRPGERSEEGYVVLAGKVVLSSAEAEIEAEGPALLRCGPDQEHDLSNAGGQPLGLLYVQVALDQAADAPPALLAEPVDRSRLGWRPAIHGGTGRVATRHLWGPEEFCSCWTFADHAVLDQGSSVGYHYHEALEECFVVLAGTGYMTIDRQTSAVGPGDVTWQGIGQAHGLYNPYPEELEFLRLAVRCTGERFTTIDLHDDLAGRRPSE